METVEFFFSLVFIFFAYKIIYLYDAKRFNTIFIDSPGFVDGNIFQFVKTNIKKSLILRNILNSFESWLESVSRYNFIQTENLQAF